LIPLFASGGFQEVSGLGADLEVMAYPEGGVNDYVHQLPVRHSWGRIVLKRGLLVTAALWTWYQAGLTQSLGARRDGTVILLTPQGVPAVAWNFRAGLAAKWTGPSFDAMRDAVAIESLEIAHQGLDQNLMNIAIA
jgi:phage tail-like protein